MRVRCWILIALCGIAASHAAAGELPDRRGGTLRLLATAPAEAQSPNLSLAVDPNALYSNVTTPTGTLFQHGGAATLAGNTITRLAADRLTLVGTPPHALGGFVFSLANNNSTALSVRPRVRFYQDNGPSGMPGVIIGGYSFDVVTVPANSVQLFQTDLTAPLLTLAGNQVWAGVTFDDNSGATGASAIQLNQMGQAVYNPVDRGSSNDAYFLTSNPGSFNSDNPAGATADFGGSPAANFAWELRGGNTVQGITRLDGTPLLAGSSARWLVRFSAPINDLNASHLGLSLPGASILSVTPNAPVPAAQWTVTAHTGSAAGDLSLSLINTSGFSTSVTNPLPVVGESYQLFINTAPTLTPALGLARQQGSAATAATLATVADGESAAATLGVSLVSSPPGITVTGLTNSNGSILAQLAAGCAAAPGTSNVVLRVTDGALSTDGAVAVTVTANTPPTLSYGSVTTGLFGGAAATPTVPPADNGSITAFSMNDLGTYSGQATVNPAGVVSLGNAQPVGTHTLRVQALDNCGLTSLANLSVTVNALAAAPQPVPTLPPALMLLAVLLVLCGLTNLRAQRR